MILYENEVRKVFEALGKDTENWNFQVLCRKVSNFDKIFKTEPDIKDEKLNKIAVYIFYNTRNDNSLTIKQGKRPMEKNEDIEIKHIEVDETNEVDFEDLIDDEEETEEDDDIEEDTEKTPKKKVIPAKDSKPFHPLGDDDEDKNSPEPITKKKIKKTKEPKQPKQSKKERDIFGYGIGTIGNSINNYILSKEVGCTTKEIIEELKLNPTTVFPHIGTLIKNGFVYRENHLIKVKENK